MHAEGPSGDSSQKRHPIARSCSPMQRSVPAQPGAGAVPHKIDRQRIITFRGQAFGGFQPVRAAFEGTVAQNHRAPCAFARHRFQQQRVQRIALGEPLEILHGGYSRSQVLR